jgi:acyl dehydratase
VLAFSVRFTGQVWPGDTLTFSGEVTAVDATEALAEIELTVVSQKDETVMTASARAKVAPAP